MQGRPSLFGLLATLAVAGLPAPAAAQPVGEEFQVNTYTTDDQDFGFTSGRTISADASGNFVVVWQSDRQDGSGYGVFGQRHDSTGAPIGSEFRVNSYTTSSQERPSVASDPTGNFVVVWYGSGFADSSGIFGQRFDSAGHRLGTEFRINSYTTGLQRDPAIASDANGNFVVVWWRPGIYGQRFDAAGNPLGAEFPVSQSGGGGQISVASDAAGNFVVVWSSGSQYYGYDGVLGQRFDSSGNPQGAEFQVDPGNGGRPSVTSDASGNFVVVWQLLDVYGQRFDSSGVPAGSMFRVNNYTRSIQERPSVASDATGNFVVAWQSFYQDRSAMGIFGRRYDSAGVPQGDEFQVNTYTTATQVNASVGATGANRFVVAWESSNFPQDGQDGSGAGVFGQRFDFGGGDPITVNSPNTNVRWRIGSLQKIQWTHSLGLNATFQIELDRDDDGTYEELIAAAAPASSATRGSFAWTVTGPASGMARVRVSWTDDLSVSDASDVTFQIRPAP